MKQLLFKQHRENMIFAAFLVCALVIVILHFLFHPVRVLDMDTSIFYMDEKYTLAAFFTTVTAFLTGFISLTNIRKSEERIKKAVDIACGVFFLGLAFDEYFEIHEYTNTLIKLSLTDGGILKTLSNFSWIFPLLVIVIFVFLLFFIKIQKSDKNVRKPLIIGVFCFFWVVIFELLGSATYGRHIYLYFVAIEEGLEMVGVSFFLLAALIESKNSLKDS